MQDDAQDDGQDDVEDVLEVGKTKSYGFSGRQ